MVYQKIINLLENTSNRPFKFRTKASVEINDDSRGTYNANSQIKRKNSMLNLSLWSYNSPKQAAAVAAANNTSKKVIFKNYTSFTDYISKINNIQVDNAKDIDVLMSMSNSIEYSDIYSKISGSLGQYYSDEPVLGNNNNITDFPANSSNSISFKVKEKITGQTGSNDTKDVNIMALKNLSNFWRTLAMLLINFEFNLIQTWSANYFLVRCTSAN